MADNKGVDTAFGMIELARSKYMENQSPSTKRRLVALLRHAILDAKLRVNNGIKEYLQNKIIGMSLKAQNPDNNLEEKECDLLEIVYSMSIGDSPVDITEFEDELAMLEYI